MGASPVFKKIIFKLFEKILDQASQLNLIGVYHYEGSPRYPKETTMKAIILSAFALFVIGMSTNSASAYYSYGPNGYVQSNQSTTNYYGSGGQYLGSATTRRW